MRYQIHSFTSRYDNGCAKMITELCEANNLRVHTAWYERDAKRDTTTVRVLFEELERVEVSVR